MDLQDNTVVNSLTGCLNFAKSMVCVYTEVGNCDIYSFLGSNIALTLKSFIQFFCFVGLEVIFLYPPAGLGQLNLRKSPSISNTDLPHLEVTMPAHGNVHFQCTKSEL